MPGAAPAAPGTLARGADGARILGALEPCAPRLAGGRSAVISILCYGRNDDHSPGIQKRAAISLNGFARLLDDPDDEIVFVDYNTPDELPTFPEAIADTLTDAARQRLRVVRVRPRDHAPWSRRTHLPVPEPLARNAGLRRTNPANPWVLSTNTDMILLPRRMPSLSALCAGLEPGCWHLPRYELPEAVWQGFTRTDPDATLAELSDLADRLPLREIVRGSEPAVFDNHGDFQLMRRDDLFAVHGFDERMLNGWAVDSNLSLRLLMRLGRVGSLAGEIDAFHCAHHRAVSRLHRHGRTENDYQRFYRDVERPDLPDQAESWGFAGVELEEIRLDGTRRRRWLGALAGADPRPVEAVYTPETADEPHYPADQVLVHLLDLLAERAADTVVGWCGARPRMLAAFVAAWRALGRTGAVLVPETCAGLAGVEPMPLPQLAERADVCVFEFGCRSQDDPALLPSRPGAWSDDDLRALAPVREALLAVTEAERQVVAGGGAPRLLITVNAVHNRFEPLILDLIGAARLPFATRLRHGYALALPAAEPYAAPSVAAWLGKRLARWQPVPVSEAVRLMGWADRLLAGDLPPSRLSEAARSAHALLALLDHPDQVHSAPPDRLEQARRAVAAARGSVRLAWRIGVPVLAGPPPDGPWRLATLEDWEDDAFAELARRHFDGPLAVNLTRRSALRWSRIRVLLGLHRRGLAGARVAVVADGFDPLADVLSTLGGRVHLMMPGPCPPSSGLRDPGRLTVGGAPVGEPFDAVVLFAPNRRVPPVTPNGVVVRVERVRVDRTARLPAGAALSTATVDSALWPGESVDLPHFLTVAEDGAVTTLAVSFEDQRTET
jgi:hypothetical protein